ncbi:hypothetical protein [Pradoshia sp.]
MKTAVYWMIWGLALVAINVGAILIALFSLFATPEGTSIFSLDYLIALSIIVLPNIISVQLFIALRKQNQKGFLFGLVLAIMEVCSFIIYIYRPLEIYIWLALLAISIIGGIILLIRTVNR